MQAQLLELHLAASAAFTGNTVGPPAVTILTGAGTFTLLVGVFFFIVVWTGVPIIEKFINFLYKGVDKLHDFWH